MSGLMRIFVPVVPSGRVNGIRSAERGEVAAGKPFETIVCRFPYPGHRGARVDKALDLGVVPGLADDGPAVGVGNEDHGPFDRVQ